jgi:AcrR family transcriptional regulator
MRRMVTRKTSAHPRARSKPGRKSFSPDPRLVTSERILEGARAVLVECGFAQFTMRRVADTVGITVGNLGYHFPSKRDLIRAVIASLLENYSQRFDALLTSAESTRTDAVAGMVRLMMLDVESRELVYTFRELWSVALRDTTIQGAVDDFYDEIFDRIVTSLQRAVPGLTIQAARELVTLSALLSEGTGVVYGTRAARRVPLQRIVHLASSILADYSKGLE